MENQFVSIVIPCRKEASNLPQPFDEIALSAAEIAAD